MAIQAKPVTRTVPGLSPRRRELLGLVTKGLTNDEIATALGISFGTVRSHVATLLEQLDVANRTEAAALYAIWAAGAHRVDAVLRRPAIAVLPIRALSSDPDVVHAAGGLTDDLASLLSRCCWFPVIATLASGEVRSKGRSRQEVAEELGAHFLVEGSLRKLRDGYRLTVSVDDPGTGIRIWSHQETLPLTSFKDAEDIAVEQIVTSVYPQFIGRVLAQLPPALETAGQPSWQLAYRGMRDQSVRQLRGNQAAMDCFRRALRLEPGLVLAHFGVGLASYDAILNQWGARPAAVERLGVAAAKCIEYAPHCAEGYFLAGRYEQVQGDWARMRAPLEAAIGRNPSFAVAHGCLAHALQATGLSDEALTRMKHAARLGPGAFVTGLATLHFMRGEYADALSVAEQAVLTHPRYSYARALAAACAFWHGDLERGQQHWRALRAKDPDFKGQVFASTFRGAPDASARFAQALDALPSVQRPRRRTL